MSSGKRTLTVSEFLSCRADMERALITYWQAFPPGQPLEGYLKSVEYSEVENELVFRSKNLLVPALNLPPVRPRIEVRMPTVSEDGTIVIVDAGPGLWSISLPRGGIVVIRSWSKR